MSSKKVRKQVVRGGIISAMGVRPVIEAVACDSILEQLFLWTERGLGEKH